MKKRGSSHLEIILSFVLFIGFIGLALYFFNPSNGSKLVDSSTDYAFREIQKNASVEVKSFSIKINSEITEDIVGFDIASSIDSRMKASAEDYDGNLLSAKRDGSWIYVDRNGKGFVIARLNEDANETGAIGKQLDESKGDYTVSSSNSEKIISEKRMKTIKEEYDSDYEGLRKNFNLPSRVNFGIELVFSDTDIIRMEKARPENLDVFSKTERIEVLRENGETVFADLNIKIW